MRNLTILPLIAAGTLAGSATAGTSAKEAMIPIALETASAPAPDYLSWFVGATGGYLFANETGFVSAHVGRNLPYQLWGWNTAAYLEVGYFEIDDCFNVLTPTITNGDEKYDKKYTPQFGVDGGGGGEIEERFCYDLDVIPITLNYKLERSFANSVSVYWGLGAGVAIFDFDGSGGVDDDDTTFFAQSFAGVIYNVTPAFEIFTGMRLIYVDEPSFRVDGVSIDTDLEEWDGLIEGGVRFSF